MKKDIGAIWKRDGKFGPYLSGVIEIDGKKHNFRIYENSYKKADKEPDYKIFPVIGKEPTTLPGPMASPKQSFMGEDDIPF
jgi:hypothetical protein